jgi:phosphoglycolate phosphatase-like HAD superfamily hydrolase
MPSPSQLTSPPAAPPPPILIFDMDGTLVDVTRSYQATVPATARRYLGLLGLVAPAMTTAVNEPFRHMGGFNDDWDLTAGLLEILLAQLPPATLLPPGPFAALDPLLAALRAAAAPLAGTAVPLPDLPALIGPVRAAGGGLPGLRSVVPRRNGHLVWRTGDALATDLVQRIFSEIYLGDRLFAQAYGVPARFHEGAGLIDTETPLIALHTLETLHRRARLGLATGRTSFEAGHILAVLDLGRFFAASAVMDDALAASHQALRSRPPGDANSFLKPHPYLLQRSAEALDPGGLLPAAYVGDMPDDVRATRGAALAGGRRWWSIAIARDPALREHLAELGADWIIERPDDLLQWWER